MTIRTPPNTRLWAKICEHLAAMGKDANSMSINKLADALGVGHGSVQRILDGHENLRADTIALVAKRLNTTSAMLISDDGVASIDSAVHATLVRNSLDESRQKESSIAAQTQHDFSPQARRVARALDEISDGARRSQVALALLDIIDEVAGKH